MTIMCAMYLNSKRSYCPLEIIPKSKDLSLKILPLNNSVYFASKAPAVLRAEINEMNERI